jgi:hypothetical protein
MQAGPLQPDEVIDMETERTSLRALVDKWLAPTAARPPRVTRLGRTSNGARFVCVEVLRLAGPLTIAFFYHDGGTWYVFPPRTGLL